MKNYARPYETAPLADLTTERIRYERTRFAPRFVGDFTDARLELVWLPRRVEGTGHYR